MIKVTGRAALAAGKPLEPFTFERRSPGPRDVLIDITHCGICHSDLHQVRDEWGGSIYPMVPGHEIVGRVVQTGAQVTRARPGDLVGVGCMVDSCRGCSPCKRGLEQYCDDGPTWTYNARERDGVTPTFGGYSTSIVVDEAFVLLLREGLSLEQAAPLLCAGITTYSPLKHLGAGPGKRVGVLGLGGLGHMAVKLAAAMGAEVVVLSHSPTKRDDALRMGARELVVSSDDAAMKRLASSLDLIIDTVSARHPFEPYLRLLRLDGAMVLVGIPERPSELPAGMLIGKRRSVAGSLIGGIAETQEMLDFCATHRIGADIELISGDDIDRAYDRMLSGDVRYRFVIDCATLR